MAIESCGRQEKSKRVFPVLVEQTVLAPYVDHSVSGRLSAQWYTTYEE